MKTIQLEAANLQQTPCILLRNNVGVLKDVRGQHVKYGLCVGSSDLIGWTICNGTAVFTAVEVKLPSKKPTQQQAAFLAAVQNSGGIACVASNMADVKRAIEEWHR